MKKGVINQLEGLYQHKQVQITQNINELKQKKEYLLSEISRYQTLIEDLYFEHTDCKRKAYSNTFSDSVMSANDIKKIHHDLQQILRSIDEHNKTQQQVTEQVNQIDDQVLALKKQLRYFIVKVEKYQMVSASNNLLH